MEDENELSPEQIEAKEKEDREDQAYFDMCLTDVMSTPNGRHIMWEIIGECGVYHNTFNPDPYINAYNSGEKSIGIKYLELILGKCPELHEKMFAEHKYIEEEQTPSEHD